MRYTVLAIVLLATCQPGFADQTVISNYSATRDHFFWDKLYPTGGRTLYCDEQFRTHEPLNIEHVYAAAWMAEALGCSSRSACRTDPVHNVRFNHMEADMHNLFPAMAGLNGARSDRHFGTIEGEKGPLVACDFEVDKADDVVEPRPAIRGDIARAIFYMHREYNLPIPFGMTTILKEWNQEDPPSTEEIWRNDAIDRLQGTRNPYIDNPGLADSL